jgi:outer membrane murein-binding lipoprotein Lpp
MGTVLRVLVVIILVLSISAFVLAWMLFGKRELLIGRTQMLEEQFIKVAKTIEAVDPGDKVQPTYEARDIEAVTDKELDNPAKSPFWNDYQFKLEGEETPLATFELNTQEKRLQLRQYYQQHPGPDGKPVDVINPLNGKKSHEGPGTMSEILEAVLKRANVQLTTLNRTRAELKKIREELNATIKDLNGVKVVGRTDKKTIVEKNKVIEGLNEEIRGLKTKIDRLEEEKRALTAEVAEAKNEIARQKETIDEMSKTIKSQEKKIKDMMGKNTNNTTTTTPTSDNFLGKISPGDKGRVVAIDEKLKFVIVELSDAFMTEVLGPNRDGALPQIDMMVRRPGMKSPSGEFVTRIRLRQVLRQQNIVVADIMIDWQQAPLEKDDVVFF